MNDTIDIYSIQFLMFFERNKYPAIINSDINIIVKSPGAITPGLLILG